MDGQVQSPVYRKNWSSLMLFNCDHPHTQRLVPERVSHETGQWLHAFSWTDAIGSLPARWNWLVDISDPIEDVAAAHFTLGTPDLAGYEKAPFAEEWRRFAI